MVDPLEISLLGTFPTCKLENLKGQPGSIGKGVYFGDLGVRMSLFLSALYDPEGMMTKCGLV